MPYGGVYRLIDFPLSNCMNSGLSDVWIVQQYQPHSLNEHVSNGRPWDLDRTYGGLRLLNPHQGDEQSGWHQGNADAIWRNKRLIAAFDPDVLVVLSSDHVYKLDYRHAIGAHLDRGAEVTMVTTKVPLEEASRFGTVTVTGDRITSFEYKPESPAGDVATTEVFLFDAAKLLVTLDDLRGDARSSEELEDLGDALLPRLVEAGRAHEYRLDGYWRDLGTVESYWSAHMELVAASPLDLDDAAWPIRTLALSRPPARVRASAHIDAGLLAPGCTIAGRVERSVLAPGVVVERGATVLDSVILHDTSIRAGATVSCAVVDSEVVVGEGAEVGATPPGTVAETDITLVGMNAVIAEGAVVGAGGRLEPGSSV
jgi:glucose-1-phosphate adenylyltransferase